MKIKQVSSALLLGLFTSQSVLADTIKVENTGVGSSLDDAIDQAVRRSIEQVKGVSMQSIRLNKTEYTRDSVKGTHSSKERETGQRTSTEGNATYRILSEKCYQSECRVRLSVNVEVPDGYERQQQLKALNKNRRTIAVEPFSGPQGKTFTKNLESKLVQDRKFKVLEDTNSENLDYVLKGRVIEARTRKNVVDNSRTVEMTGEHIKDVKTYYSSKFLVEYKLIDRVNQQVKWSDTIPTTSSRNNLSLLLDISASKVFTQLKENIYPLVAIKTADGLVLNSGGKSVKQGQYYDIYVMGEKLVDPYTKETLGYSEKKVARVKVTRVLPKSSYVSVVSGDVSSVDKHAIARLAKNVAKPRPKPAPRRPKEPEAPASPPRISF